MDAREAVAEVKEAAREVAPWVERLARVGYAAKAVVYVVIGLLALGALSSRRETPDSEGAMAAIVRQPFGKSLLVIIAIGLLGYALWRIIEAFVDPQRKGEGVKGLGWRGWMISRGLFHAALAFQAITYATRSAGGSSGEGDTQQKTETIMGVPFGPWLVVLVGLGIAGYGIGQIVMAVRGKLAKRLEQGGLRSMSPGLRKWAVRISRYGLGARGVLFTIIGGFLAQAGFTEDPDRARGLGGAFRVFDSPAMLAIIALGVISYGVYEAIKARYARIDVA
ncbi:MAG TPA: DUF1206 domain-containing protein [Thermoanaerobaculia bacterium]|nr:DUF1206 domain-containing protein [Thermoanaerobaculia bacterium]